MNCREFQALNVGAFKTFFERTTIAQRAACTAHCAKCPACRQFVMHKDATEPCNAEDVRASKEASARDMRDAEGRAEVRKAISELTPAELRKLAKDILR